MCQTQESLFTSFFKKMTMKPSIYTPTEVMFQHVPEWLQADAAVRAWKDIGNNLLFNRTVGDAIPWLYGCAW